MPRLKSYLLALSALCFLAATLRAQEAALTPAVEDHSDHDHAHNHGHDHAHSAVTAPLQFIPNQRQWDDRIVYASPLGGLNQLFLENDRFTFLLYSAEQTSQLHDWMQHRDDEDFAPTLDGHVYTVRFNGANTATFSTEQTASHRVNYLLGNDPGRWAKNVPLHGKVSYGDLYPGIDLDAYSQGGNFKYDFVVRPGGKASSISLSYDGLDGLRLIDGALVLQTSVGELKELQPYAYQNIGGRETPVPCHYVLTGATVTFDLPEGYNEDFPLIIDPTVVGATLAGSTTSESFGHSATFDNAGNMYGAGISFGFGYPATTGAFQEVFAGGQVDIAISKFTPDGSDLIYATYIGGNSAEYPHSMIVDASGQLSLYGTTLSFNYPTTANALQTNLAGATDIVISKLSPDGSSLVGSTYLGGSGTDGISRASNNVSNGDQYRGEIVLDAAGNIYVATGSESTNFPVTANAFQTERSGNSTFSGDQDGVIFKINSDLSTLFWSTYLGGSGTDLATSLRVDDDNTVYVSGFAAQDDFPMVAGGAQPNFPGGQESAFIVRIAADGSQLLNGTYWGTDRNDRSYFLDTDELNQVHIFGLSQGDMPVTPGVFSTAAGSKQFVSGFTADLSQNIYSTIIGLPDDGFTRFDFLPVAFMVDKCNGIYISGHSSREGLPLTDDAVFTEANSFYLAKLEPDATALTFGSYYGQANHVDGGTSRFDKGGVVYQGVCSCTDGGRVMNTTDGAWRENQIQRCDIGVFKIDFDVDVVTAQGVASPSTSGCVPLTIDFEYTGRDAQNVTWDFGNGDTGSGENVSYTFTEAGSYTVQQIATSPTSCNPTDTFFLRIDVLDENSTQTELGFCEGEDLTFLDASTQGATYNWQDGTTSATYQPDEAGIYWVDVSVEGCTRRDSFLLTPLSALAVDLGDDVRVCDQPSLLLDASNGDAVSYNWINGSGEPTFLATNSGNYAVTLTHANGCTARDQVLVNFGESATIDLGEDQTICEGTSTTLNAVANGATFVWQDGSTGPTFTANAAGVYRVDALRDGCPSSDSVLVNTLPAPVLDLEGKDRLCPDASDGSVRVTATGGGTSFDYLWDTGETSPLRSNLAPGSYTITVINEIGCETTSTREIIETSPVTFSAEAIDIPCDEAEGGVIALFGLDGGSPPYRYSFNGAAFDTTTFYDGLPGGFYTIAVRDSLDCEVSEEVRIIAPREIVVEAGQDAFLKFGDSTQLTGAANTLEGLLFSWSPALDLGCVDCLQPFASPLAGSTVYTFTALDSLSGCFYQDSVTVRVDQTRNVYVPNAFSPNGDGINDRFFINTDQSVSRVNYLRIYGRWGQLVFEGNNLRPNDPSGGWDGTMNGRATGGEVFAYVLEVTFLDGLTRTYSGDVTLMR